MKIRILASASRDLIEGYRFYEFQADGVGAYFLDSLFSDIDSLVISAGMHSVHFGKYHRLLAQALATGNPRPAKSVFRAALDAGTHEPLPISAARSSLAAKP